MRTKGGSSLNLKFTAPLIDVRRSWNSYKFSEVISCDESEFRTGTCPAARKMWHLCDLLNCKGAMKETVERKGSDRLKLVFPYWLCMNQRNPSNSVTKSSPCSRLEPNTISQYLAYRFPNQICDPISLIANSQNNQQIFVLRHESATNFMFMGPCIVNQCQ
jgi:hypothetical protein